MDLHCTDICPAVSAEFLAAYHNLGPAAARAAFIAVNVNAYYRMPAGVAAFSRAHQLTAIPAWCFLTGALASLRAVWDSYEIAVQAPSRTADVVDTSLVYFIDRPRATSPSRWTNIRPARRHACRPETWLRGGAE